MDGLITFFIFLGYFAFLTWYLFNFKKIDKKNKEIEEKWKKKNKFKKPWIEFPNPLVILLGILGILYLVSAYSLFTEILKIIGPLGLFFLILWILSANSRKE